MATIKTYGTIGGFALTQQSRPIVDGDYLKFPLSAGINSGNSAPRLVAVLNLSNGTISTDFAAALVEDATRVGEVYALTLQANAVLNAFAAIGAQVVLGDPGAPVTASPNATGPYTRAVTLTPGTPLPPGRGVRVKGGSGFVLKMAAGGTLSADDPTGGSGSIISNVAVVDATVPTGGTVQILY
ncbi:hypothetical protein ACFQE0_21485 [Methylobacterium komagatae]|uniref:DUF2190 family protein n=1 Tax=Methylobacterium komagatae TaxID=374425 RepID=A0ABW2BQ11_9HYPH